jgi:hypothetical protein
VPNEQGLYFQVGNLYQKLKRRDWVVNLAPTFPPFHVFGFNPRSLKKALAKHNFAVKDWKVYGGKSFVPSRQGFVSLLEQHGASIVTSISRIGQLGTYFETWAIRN